MYTIQYLLNLDTSISDMQEPQKSTQIGKYMLCIILSDSTATNVTYSDIMSPKITKDELS